MSLKVLLADDSAAIKKVVQLSLQDYAVDLKNVGSGKDVLDVARTFKPEIIFVDVLLPHKTGYEVATEIKKDAELQKIPVVMLWSSFMVFDEAKFKSCGAEGKLEKPFEVAALRDLINKFVPKTQANPIARHLEFAKPQFDPSTASSVSNTAPSSVPNFELPTPSQGNENAFDIDFGSAENDTPAFGANPFGSANIETPAVTPVAVDSGPNEVAKMATTDPDSPWGGDSDWVRKDISKFKIPIPEENFDNSPLPFSEKSPLSAMSEANINPSNFLKATVGSPQVSGPQLNTNPESATPIRPNVSESTAAAATGAAVLDAKTKEAWAADIKSKLMLELEATVKAGLEAKLEAQTKEIIERIVWKLVPDIAANIIKEELNQLLDEPKS